MANAGKGQGSSEYLIIFGVVLIIAIIVVGLLGFFPGTSGDSQVAESKSYWNTALPFSIVDSSQSSNGAQTVSLVVENHGGYYAEISNVTLTFGSSSATNATRQYFPPGERNVLYVNSPPNSCQGRSGGVVQYNVVFQYDQDPLVGKIQSGSKPLLVRCS